MQPQDAAIVGGTVLRIPAIQSPNYVPGVSGWIIQIDGSAEFNNLTIRGQFVGTNFVINTQGAFFYSGVPANGNLIASIAATAGTDAHGNAYSAGVEVFFPSAPLQITMNPATGRLEFFGEAAQAGGTGSAAFIGYQSPGNTSQLLLHSGIVQAAAVEAVLELISGTTTPAANPFIALSDLVAFIPGTFTPEVWNNITGGIGYSNSWTDFGGGHQAGRYRKSPENRVWLDGDIKPGTYTNGTTIFTLPAGYRPVALRSTIKQAEGNGGGTFSLDINTSGAVSVNDIVSTAPAIVDLSGISFPLD